MPFTHSTGSKPKPPKPKPKPKVVAASSVLAQQLGESSDG